MDKLSWGILSTAKIAREKVIPAIHMSRFCRVYAIASRDKQQAETVANRLNIPVAYGTYEELLNDTSIDAVYIPLPNNLHVPWAIKALEAGKHVLCEKPVAMSLKEATLLLRAAELHPHLKIMEAFMYRFHPQWQHAKTLAANGALGDVKTIQSFFSYFNDDLQNIRNKKELGGGGMMDIGCYCVSLSRFIFEKEPHTVFGSVEFDSRSQTDRLASGLLDFAPGISSFTCSTQASPYQRVNIVGTSARLEIEIPFNAPPDKATRIWLHKKEGTEEIIFEAINQYSVQCDLFSRAVLDGTPVPTPLQDAINNMSVIEAVFQSADEGMCKRPFHSTSSS